MTIVMHTEYDSADCAVTYWKNGLTPIPIPHGTKAPIINRWNSIRWTSEAEIRGAFSPCSNIGIALGGEPTGIVDIDLDSEVARRMAPAFLPVTATTGRKSSPRSHWWYRALGVGYHKFRLRSASGKHSCLLEVRSSGHQTVVGPSVHPNGERIDMLLGTPLEIDRDRLIGCVTALARCVWRIVNPDVPIPVGELGFADERGQARRTVAVPQDNTTGRAAQYVAKCDPAVSGCHGHNKTFTVAMAIVHRFGLTDDQAMSVLLSEFNHRCLPPWSERELLHKIRSAREQTPRCQFVTPQRPLSSFQ